MWIATTTKIGSYEMGENEKIIKIEVDQAKEFRLVPATGAMGGPNPQGEIICNFFVEHPKNPSLEVSLDKTTGRPVREVSVSPNTFVRQLQIAVVMRPDIALSVGQWLIKQAKTVMQPENQSIQ